MHFNLKYIYFLMCYGQGFLVSKGKNDLKKLIVKKKKMTLLAEDRVREKPWD